MIGDTRAFVAACAFTAVMATAAHANGGSATIISYGKAEKPGLAVEAATFQKPTSPTRSIAPAESPSESLDAVPVPVAISAHNCIPRTDARGVSLDYQFFESGVGDCVSFVSPPPRAPLPSRRDQPNRSSPEALAAGAFERVMELAPEPHLDVAPARLGLTGLRSYFWVGNELDPISATATAGRLTVTAEARPVQHTWDFGDGATRTTRHPGRPWTRRQNGNVGHLYETKGRYEPSVTTTWAARWRTNQGPWRDLGYFSTTGSIDYRVREMIARLVRRR